SQTEAEEHRSRSVDWRMVAGLAAAIILSTILTVGLLQRRSEAKAPAPPPPPRAAAAAEPVPQPLPAKAPAVHHAQIRLNSVSWVTIAADGGDPVKTLLNKGAVRDFDFSQAAVVELTSSVDVDITVDGAPMPPLRSGAHAFQLTADGIEL